MKWAISLIRELWARDLEELLLLLGALGSATVLVEQTEGTLLGLVALAGQVLQGLLACSHLLAAYNTTVLVLDQILLGQATGGVLGSSVENLGLGASGHFEFGHLIQMTAILLKGVWLKS
jgi:hypothetical protein